MSAACSEGINAESGKKTTLESGSNATVVNDSLDGVEKTAVVAKGVCQTLASTGLYIKATR